MNGRVVVMHFRCAVMFLLCVAPLAGAQTDRARRDQVSAATAAAVRGLKEAVAANSLANGVTVATLLDKTNGHEKLTETLRRAEQIGGPRWIDEQTCQVRLEISGARVAGALVQIAASQPKKSPLPPDVLAFKLKDWDKRTFSATGSSTGATEIEHARPGSESGAWSGVSDEDRRRAVAAAKDDAINRALESIRDIKLPDGKTAADALAQPGVSEKLRGWLAARPVTEVVFRDDRTVGVSLAVPPAEFFTAFRDAVVAAQAESPAWEAVRADFQRRLVAPTGNASASGAPVARPTLLLPALPPVWTNRQVEAEGAAALVGSKLKCARAAEADAVKNLAAQIETLPLNDQQTLGQVAQTDPQVRAAIDRAAARARTNKVEYDSDGGAKVRVQLNLQDVWEELRAAR